LSIVEHLWILDVFPGEVSLAGSAMNVNGPSHRQ